MRAETVLTGVRQRICMQLVMASAAHLLSLVDARAANADDGEDDARALQQERAAIAKAEAYYKEAANGQAQMVYFGGMAAVVVALSVVAAVWLAIGWASPVAALIAGAVGAVVSVIQRINNGKFTLDFDVGRPYAFFLGGLRPLIGGAFAMAISFAFTGGLLHLPVAANEPTRTTGASRCSSSASSQASASAGRRTRSRRRCRQRISSRRHRPRRAAGRAPTGQATVTPPSRAELLRLDYEQTTDLLRTLADVRFKLLALVPTLSGAAVALLGHPGSAAELLALGCARARRDARRAPLRAAQQPARRLRDPARPADRGGSSAFVSIAGGDRPGGLFSEAPEPDARDSSGLAPSTATAVLAPRLRRRARRLGLPRRLGRAARAATSAARHARSARSIGAAVGVARELAASAAGRSGRRPSRAATAAEGAGELLEQRVGRDRASRGRPARRCGRA